MRIEAATAKAAHEPRPGAAIAPGASNIAARGSPIATLDAWTASTATRTPLS